MTQKHRSDAGKPRYEASPKQHVSVALSPDDPIEKEIIDGIAAEIDGKTSQKNALVRWYKKLTGKGE